MAIKFELNRLPRNCSNEEIIAEIKRVDAIVNKDVLTLQDFDKHGKMSSSRIMQRFGGWHRALIAADLDHKYGALPVFIKARGKKLEKLTDNEILIELKRIAKMLNKEFVTTEDVRNHSKIMSEAVVARRFGSWTAGLKKAGLKISPLGHRYSLEDYFENLLNVWTHHGRQPLYREMDEFPSVISSGGYEGRFGSWRKALEVFVIRMNEGELENNKIANIEKPDRELIDVSQQKKQESKHKIVIPKTEDRRSISLSLRYKVLSRDNFRCVRCGRSPATNLNVELHVDHKNPFKPGKPTLEDLETKCKECNLGKGNRHIE